MKKIQSVLLLLFSLCILCQCTYAQKDIVATVYFKPGSHSIKKKYYKKLDEIAKQLKTDDVGMVRVFGYADKTGFSAYNNKLSKKRADAVYAYLAKSVKIDEAKRYITWVGDTKEANDEDFPAASTQKRRVDIWVTFYKREEMRPL